jgi:hypothetical protein
MNTTTAGRRVRARRAVSLTAAGIAACLALVATPAHATRIPPDTTVPATRASHDIDDVVAARKVRMSEQRAAGHQVSATGSDTRPGTVPGMELKRPTALAHIVAAAERFGPGPGATCHVPETLDAWSRRLIAVQLCGRVHVVPAVLLARAPYGDPPPRIAPSSPVAGAVGHCGHEGAHQPASALGLPVSAWFTPTSC